MIICDEIKELINKEVNSASTDDEAALIEKHIATCSGCHKHFTKAVSIKQLLGSQNPEMDTLPENFNEEFHLALVSNEEPQLKKSFFDISFFAKPRTFMIAAISLSIIAISVFYFSKEQSFVSEKDGRISRSEEPAVKVEQDSVVKNRGAEGSSETGTGLLFTYNPEATKMADGTVNNEASVASHGTLISETEVDAGKSVIIEIEYDAAKELKGVIFTVSLDEGLTFASKYEKVKKLKNHSWKGDLKKGINKIPFKVNVIREGSWSILTKADFEGYSHKHKVILSAENSKIKIAYYRLPEKKLADET